MNFQIYETEIFTVEYLLSNMFTIEDYNGAWIEFIRAKTDPPDY